MGLSLADQRRFWMKVALAGPDDCWLWMAGLTTGGYGRFSWRNSARQESSNRIAYLDTVGDFDRALWVLHTCDNRRCCNPAHLYLGTPQQNIVDRDRRNRRRPPMGELNGRAKLTRVRVDEMRSLFATGQYTQAHLVARFNTTKSTVGNVLAHNTWR